MCQEVKSKMKLSHGPLLPPFITSVVPSELLGTSYCIPNRLRKVVDCASGWTGRVVDFVSWCRFSPSIIDPPSNKSCMEPDPEIDRLEWEQLRLNSLLEEVKAIRAAVQPLKKISHNPIQKYDDLLRDPKFSELMGRYRNSPTKPISIRNETLTRLANPLPHKDKTRREPSIERRQPRRDASIDRKVRPDPGRLKRETFITETKVANNRGRDPR